MVFKHFSKTPPAPIRPPRDLTRSNNTSGANNTAVGSGALAFNGLFGNNNTGIGANALHGNTTGSNNIAVGFNAGINRTTGNNNIDIGDSGNAGESNAIRIGHPSSQKRSSAASVGSQQSSTPYPLSLPPTTSLAQ